MAEQGLLYKISWFCPRIRQLRWLVTGLMQIPVCLALMGAGFNFDDLKSTVIFLYAFNYIMMAFKAFFRFLIHQDCDEDVWSPMVIFNGVTQVALQIWGLSGIWKNNNISSEETPTVISAIIIVIVELVWVVIMVVKICEQLGARMSKMKPTNSRTPRDINETNGDQDGLINNQNITDTE